MKSKAYLLRGTSTRSLVSILALALMSAALPGCRRGEPETPAPRPIVIRSGVRLYADADQMKATDAWFRPQLDNITNDPSFMVMRVERDTPSYPWESLVLGTDTVWIGVQRGYVDAERLFEVYAHYHLMKKMGRIEEFLPGGEDLEGFSLERAILARVADAWLLGRAVYQVEAFDPLEELVYANENGYLNAMLLTARGDEFKEERRAWLKEDPEALERYRRWFVDTFSSEPPGLRETG
jgi:hypothetical protein